MKFSMKIISAALSIVLICNHNSYKHFPRFKTYKYVCRGASYKKKVKYVPNFFQFGCQKAKKDYTTK
jgi:hypothetical protein